MFEDFGNRNNPKQEDDEDSETLSYSYPSYSRFTYTGKTKSRLGRNRFMRQTGNKDETTKPADNISGTSDLKLNPHFLQSNSQAPKTPGVSWPQQDSSLSAHPFTPGGNTKTVQKSYSDLSDFPSQSNFLFNLKNDSIQNSSCKQNLPFSTTPFKSKAVTGDNQCNNNPLRELNQLIKPENPFSKLDFFSLKAENKENTGKTKTDNEKTSNLDPSWNQLKKICDSAVTYNFPETNEGLNKDTCQSDFGKTNKSLTSSFSAPFSAFERSNEKKRDDNSSNTPLDLSSAESTGNRTLYCRSLMSGSDHLDCDTSGLNHQIKDSTKETIGKADESIIHKTNTDALSVFLPKFLVPKNKNNEPEPSDDDVSGHSIGTTVERTLNFQPQAPFQKLQILSQASIKTQTASSADHDIDATGNKAYSSSQDKTAFHNGVQKTSPSTRPINFSFKNQTPYTLPHSNNEVQSSSKLKLHHNTDKKTLPPFPGSSVSLEPPKLSPHLTLSIPDLRNSVNDGQHLLKKDQNHYQQNLVNTKVHSLKNEKERNILAQNIDTKLGIVPKSSANDQLANQIIPDKNLDTLKVANLSLNSANEIGFPYQCKSETKPGENLNQLVTPQQKLPLSNQVHCGSESVNILNDSEIRLEPRPSVPLESGERNSNQVSLQQDNVLPKPAVIDQRNPAMYSRPPDNIQLSHLSQKTYLAPQQPLDRNNAGDFPHVKPDIPQQISSKPSFPVLKKPNQFKISAPRGMPSRADTELSVNGKSYAILSMLGKGGSSEVFQVLDSSSSKLLAVKCVDLSMVDKMIADGYLNEIDLLSKLQGCASVIRMFDYEYVQECKMLYVVMEKGDTDLSHLIRDISKTKKISMSMIIYYWTEMLQAVKDIHDQGIIHSDLKPANFLLVSGRLKLIDFGIASSQGDMTSVVKEVTTGTWNYMSPEAIKNTSTSGKGFKITYKSDVWSLGCILYNLVYGKTPFSHITNTWGKLTAIADPNHCIEFADVGAPAVLVKALRSCFHREPKLRPTVAELLSLPYHSTSNSVDLSSLGRQVYALLPAQWWLKVAHLFPEVKQNQEVKSTDNAG